MNEKEVIEALEQFAKEYPDGFSADVLKVIRDLKAELEEAKADKIIAETHEKAAKEILVEVTQQLKMAKSEAIQEQNSDGRI